MLAHGMCSADLLPRGLFTPYDHTAHVHDQPAFARTGKLSPLKLSLMAACAKSATLGGTHWHKSLPCQNPLS